MILRNYYKALMGAITCQASSDSRNSYTIYNGNTGVPHITVSNAINYSGNVNFGIKGSILYSPSDISNIHNVRKLITNKNLTTGGIILGDGNESVSFDDYKLSGNVIQNISATTIPTVEYNENGFTLTTILTVTNSNETSITVSEIGLLAPASPYAVLIERSLLESPITIESGGVGQITYVINFTYPDPTV